MAGNGGGEGEGRERGKQDVLMGDGVGVQDEIWPVRQGGTVHPMRLELQWGIPISVGSNL